MKQLFFRADEEDEAFAAAAKHDAELFGIIDKRSKTPTIRMFVLTEQAVLQMKWSKLWKRMWVTRLLHRGEQRG
jgi:hypothetical protein